MRRFPSTLVALFALLAGPIAGCSGDDGPGGTGPPPTDSSPPTAVTDLVLGYEPNTGAVRLSWTAPSDDSAAERVSAYEIRVEYTDGYAPSDFWSTAAAIADPPEPGAPGSPESFEILDPKRARDIHVGILAIDEAGNRAPAGEPESVHVAGFAFGARCLDVFTGLPVEGLRATLSNGESWDYTTDASGGFFHAGETDDGFTHVEVRSGAAATVYHTINETLVFEGDSVHTFFMIPVEAVGAPWAPNLLGLFNRLAYTLPPGALAAPRALQTPQSPQPRILAKWRRRPVACYIPPFVNSYGVDYELQAKLAATRWMERTGEPLFEFVDTPPDTGIIVVYKPQSEIGGIAFTRRISDEEGHPVQDVIRIVSEAANSQVIYKVFLHELGHTISLGHTDDRSFIMFVAQPLPGDISDDETRVVRLHESLPLRIDMAIYDENAPSNIGARHPTRVSTAPASSRLEPFSGSTGRRP